MWLSESEELWRTRTGPAQQRAMPAVFGLGPDKAVSANFLFATYICFTKNNKSSPARHWVCLGQGEKCYCSAFSRAMACSQREPALPANTTSNQPHSSLQAHFWAETLVQALDLRACHQDSSPAVLPLHSIHFQCGQEDARRVAGTWGVSHCHSWAEQ